MDWITLNNVAQLEEIKAASFRQPQLIFKHSTRCSISSMAKNRLDRNDTPEGIQFHYLDLIAYRDISNKIAEDFFVEHESPQVILIRNGEATYDESHSGISIDEIMEQATK